MTKKEEIKAKIHEKVDDIVDAVEKIGDINYFEFGIKSVNGDLIIKLENTYKERIK